MSDENDTAASIAPKPDGPLIVKNLGTLRNKDGDIETSATMAFCRCGQSSKKPFCDGTHKTAGFSSDKLEGRAEDKRNSYQGKEITIHDNRSICAHAGYCTDRLSSVFRMRQEPWIDPDGAGLEEITAVVDACPSGALSYTISGVERDPQERDAQVHIAPNGPYIVSGAIELLGTEQAPGGRGSSFTLCRCGGSKNKPFCDGSHWHIKFIDDSN